MPEPVQTLGFRCHSLTTAPQQRPHVPVTEDAAKVVLKVARATETPDHCLDGLAGIRPVVPMTAQRHAELHPDETAVGPPGASQNEREDVAMDMAALVTPRNVDDSIVE